MVTGRVSILVGVIGEFETHSPRMIIEPAVLDDQNRACSFPALWCECTRTGGVIVVAQGAQSLRRPSIVEKQRSLMINDTATELCRCGRCTTPPGSEFIATVSVGRMLRVASCCSAEKISADPAISRCDQPRRCRAICRVISSAR